MIKKEGSVMPTRGAIRTKSQKIGYLYILPWIIGFLLFQFYPLVSSLYYSFTDYPRSRPA